MLGSMLLIIASIFSSWAEFEIDHKRHTPIDSTLLLRQSVTHDFTLSSSSFVNIVPWLVILSSISYVKDLGTKGFGNSLEKLNGSVLPPSLSNKISL